MLKRLAFLLVLLVLAPRLVAAQTVATPGNHLGFDLPGQSIAVANGSTYNAYLDASTTPAPLAGVTCSAGTPATTATCVANWPAMQPGSHTLTVTQAQGGVESAKSAPLSFTMVIVVTPQNVRQVP